VQLAWTADFDEESARFGLRFCCEDCGYFDSSAERCRHDWPTSEHRRDRYARAADEKPPLLTFCKEFELC